MSADVGQTVARLEARLGEESVRAEALIDRYDAKLAALRARHDASAEALREVLALFPPDRPEGDGQMTQSRLVRDSWIRRWRQIAATNRPEENP